MYAMLLFFSDTSWKILSFYDIYIYIYIYIQINDDLTRGSAAIACRRFKGTHSHDRIAEFLENISTDFGISYRKIVATVTDNGANFVKCFKEFGITAPNEEDDNQDEEIQIITMDDEENLALIILEIPKEPLFSLPNHLRCSSHTLNLVATTDAAKALKNSLFSRLNHAVMGKCSALWNAAGKSKSSEIVNSVIGQQLLYPCVTRWNSMYDSVLQINQLGKKLNSLMQEVKLPVLKENELEFIEEYILVMKPIAVALDKLKEEETCYYECLIPTLLVTKEALLTCEANNMQLRYCLPLLKAVLSGYEARFQKFLDLDPSVMDAILASVSHPYFKLRWVSLAKGGKCDSTKEVKSQLKIYLQASVRKITSLDVEMEEKCSDSGEDDFFKSLEGSSLTLHNKEDLETLNYFQDPSKNVSSLLKYLYVLRDSKQYNTPLPSSASVERLFSFAGMINNPKRTRLSDKKFEHLVLKANLKLNEI